MFTKSPADLTATQLTDKLCQSKCCCISATCKWECLEKSMDLRQGCRIWILLPMELARVQTMFSVEKHDLYRWRPTCPHGWDEKVELSMLLPQSETRKTPFSQHKGPMFGALICHPNLKREFDFYISHTWHWWYLSTWSKLRLRHYRILSTETVTTWIVHTTYCTQWKVLRLYWHSTKT